MFWQKLTTAALFVTLLLLVAPGASNAQYAINTIAGGGPNGLPALSSSIGYPAGYARDTLGNIYILDNYSSRIFKVNSAGTLTVFAGNGSGIGGPGGYSGDGGPAISAQLGRPTGIAIDASGNVYVADTQNSVIRCVVAAAGGCLGSTLAAGSITTVAGTGTAGYSGDGAAATSAQLSNPYGVFVDSLGNIFIADTDNSVIRCVVGVAGGCLGSALAVGSITTVAGNEALGAGYSGDGAAATSAKLNLPNGVFVDSNGNIFIADTENSTVRCVVGVAGGCLGSALAVGSITTVAGDEALGAGYSGDGAAATSAKLNLPNGVFVDSNGNIFIADTENSTIRCVVGVAGGCLGSALAVGSITTLAGNAALGPGYSGDGAAATSAQLDLPNNIFVDSLGNLFIVDTSNFVIREVSGGTIQTSAGNHTVALSGDGGAPTNASMSPAGGVSVDGSGNIFIADTYNSVIREIVAATGNIQTVAGNGTGGYSGDGAAATSAQLEDPQGVFVDSLGDIFIADTGNSVIRCVLGTAGGCLGSALAVGSITTVAGSVTLGPGFSGDGAAATGAQLQDPQGVFVDSLGDIFIADSTNSRIRCVVGTAGGCLGSTIAVGSITTVAGNGTECQNVSSNCGDGGLATSAQLHSPQGVSADSFGNIFIADTLDSKIREVLAATGNIQTVVGTSTPGYSGDGGPAASAQLNTPSGVFVDTFGNIFIADTDNSVVREVIGVTGNIQTVAGNGTEGYSGDAGPGGSAQLFYPSGVASDVFGNLFVADTENARIRKLVSTVSISSVPTSATLPTGGPQQFAANVTGAGDASVTWQVNGITGGNATVGTISSLGSYLAPVAVPTPAIVTVTAVANANGVNSASSSVTIVSGATTLTVTVSTTPTVTEVYLGTTQTFVASVTDNANTAVNWQVNGVLGGNSTVGTISTAGLYTAPATVPTPATVIIGAVSQADATVSGSYPMLIVTPPAASQPAPQTVAAGGTATYSLALEKKAGYSKQVITLSCLKSSLPTGATCTFTPPTILPGSPTKPFTLMVNLATCSASLERPNGMFLAPRLFASLLPMAALLLFGWDNRKKSWQRLLMLVLLCVPLAGLIGCGGGSSGSSCPNVAGVYNIVVQGTTPANPTPVTITTVTLTVQ